MSLQDLINELEQATGPSFVLDGRIQHVLVPGRDDMMPPNYSASVDASLRLCTNTLPGWTIASIGQDDRKGWHAELREGYRTAYSTVALSGAPTAALALCLAITKAKLAQEEQP